MGRPGRPVCRGRCAPAKGGGNGRPESGKKDMNMKCEKFDQYLISRGYGYDITTDGASVRGWTDDPIIPAQAGLCVEDGRVVYLYLDGVAASKAHYWMNDDGDPITEAAWLAARM